MPHSTKTKLFSRYRNLIVHFIKLAPIILRYLWNKKYYTSKFLIRFYSGSDLARIEFDLWKIINPKIIWTTLDQTRYRRASNPDRIWSKMLIFLMQSFSYVAISGLASAVSFASITIWSISIISFFGSDRFWSETVLLHFLLELV